jgi:diguanylate cyclase (GGDEF)-like protein/PAS domain S-box-containing protein
MKPADWLREHTLPLVESVLTDGPLAFAIADAKADDQPLLFVNAAFERLTGYAAEEVLGRNCRFLQGEQTDPSHVAELRNGIQAGERTIVTLLNYRRDGEPFWNRVVIIPIVANGEIVQLFGALTDVTAEREAVDRVEQAEQRYRRLVEGLPLCTYQMNTGPGGPELTFVSPQVEEITGFAPDRWLGSPDFWLSRVHPDDRGRVLAAQRRRFEGDEPLDVEYRLCCAENRTIWVWDQDTVVRDARGRVVGRDGFLVDVTFIKSAEAILQFQASHDQLTALPNRSLLHDRLTHALRNADRRGSRVAVLFVDLDDFKLINDSLGHQSGDRLLRALVPRLHGALRASDTLARFGGDEFVVVCENIDEDEDAALVAQRVLEAARQPVDVDGTAHVMTASVGIAIADAEHDASSIIRDADAAMYAAKRAGRDRFEFFDPALRDQVVQRLTIEAALRGALDREELSLVYQPIVEVDTGQPYAVEALLRWHPQAGAVSPASFIPIAESTGLIVPIGRWVLRTACAQLAAWQVAGATSGLKLRVNVAARQMMMPRFAGDVCTVLTETGVASGDLGLELTESALMDDNIAVLENLARLRDIGVDLLLDDFGTGYSSLSRLHELPLDVVKIDRSFVARLATADGRSSDAVVDAIIRLADALGLATVAEGVETAEQRVRLAELGCRRAQGFFFSAPLPPEDLDRWAATASSS